MSPRLEDKIQQLCNKAVAATEQAELEEAITELRAALKEHIRRTRERVIMFPAPEQRRSASKQ
jgi:hypothetical protein